VDEPPPSAKTRTDRAPEEFPRASVSRRPTLLSSEPPGPSQGDPARHDRGEHHRDVLPRECGTLKGAPDVEAVSHLTDGRAHIVPNRKYEQSLGMHQAAVHRQLRFQLGLCRNIKRQR
jgi:hypothetical protein